MHFDRLKRREFITLLGGAAAWPLAARAQQPAMPVIGLLDPDRLTRWGPLRAFRQGLKDTGYVEGENVAIEYRWAENQIDRLPELAADLVRRQVAVIAAAGGTASAMAAKAATTTIPIVFIVAEDPVGLAWSPASPGRAATSQGSISSRLSWWQSGWNSCASWCPERLVLPCSSIRPMLRVPRSTLRDVEAAARAMGLQIQVFNASTSREIDAAFATLVRERPDALFVGTDTFFTSRRVQLVNLATRHAIPATYSSGNLPKSAG